MIEAQKQKALHDLRNTVNSLFFTLEQVQISNQIQDQDIQEVVCQCLDKKAQTLIYLNMLKEILVETEEEKSY